MRKQVHRVQQKLGVGTRVFLPLLESGVLADVSIESCDGELVAAHSALLAARSSYFAGLFRVAQTRVMRLPPVEARAAIVRAVLRFLYTDELPLVGLEEAREFLLLASRWKIRALLSVLSSLKELCVGGPVEPLASHMGALLRSGAASDVTLVLDDARSFPLHRAVLAANSAYFAAQFTAPFRERDAREVPLLGELDAEVFGAALQFWYTQRWDNAWLGVSKELRALADYLQSESLMSAITEAYTTLRPTFSTLCELWPLAPEPCVSFLVDNFADADLQLLPRELIVRALRTGDVALCVGDIMEKMVRYGCAVANVPFSSTMQLANHPPVIEALKGMLPPEVLLNKDSKNVALGGVPMHMRELV